MSQSLEMDSASSPIQDELALDGRSIRAVLDVLPAAVYITGPTGLINYYNDAASELWGHRPPLGENQWCGSWKLYHPDGTDMPREQSPMAIAIREKRAVRGMEAVVERPDGSRVPFTAYPTPFFDANGEVTGAVSLLVDVTGWKSVEQYADRLAAIVESSNDAIASKTLDGIITSWNRGAERLFGYTAEEAIGRSITMLIPDGREDEETSIIARIRCGERVEPYDTVRQRKDGSLVHISLSISPIRNANGEIVGASKIAHDITERVRAREQQALLIREINHRIKNLVATVQAIARRTLPSLSDAERSTFFARLTALAGAHELITDDHWHAVPLQIVIRRALDPFRDANNDRFDIASSGRVQLDAQSSSQLTMVLHELATNAVKYGALSNETGRINLTAHQETDDGSPFLVVSWEEHGGPRVVPPEREGFGSQLIRRVTSGDGGTAELSFDPAGVRCTVMLPLSNEASGG